MPAMKAVMVMFDSLNRRMLPSYGCDWVHAPNFQRLARRTATFDQSYVCSMPCMPARRDLHTGRPNFLHRGWGPIEPFDDSMPERLKRHGVYTYLATDHQHYWEDGGCTYHQRYSAFELVRGQEGDKWHPLVHGVPPRPDAVGRNAGGEHSDQIEFQDRVNRRFMPRECDMPQPRTFDAGLRFIDLNHDADHWLCQIETFDPHEPFFTQPHDRDLYAGFFDRYGGDFCDWPPYHEVREDADFVEAMRRHNAALVSMCDRQLGRVLDAMDRYAMWDDTMLIVWTDHGFLLGEHDLWAKIWCPFYDEVAHTPFFMWDPRAKQAGVRRRSLVQPSIDLPVTLLEYFGVGATKDMLGYDLADTIADDKPVREAAIFGVFGGHVNVTDGRYVYWCAPPEGTANETYEYTLMPTRMKHPFKPEELAGRTELAEPFSFTKGCRTLKIRGGQWRLHPDHFHTRLFDLERDPTQSEPIVDDAIEARMRRYLAAEMKRCDAPLEQFTRLGLEIEPAGV